MKATGKRSIASILAIGLHIARVIIFVTLIGLTIAVLFAPMAPAIVEWAGENENVNMEGESDFDAGDYLEIVIHFITVWVMFYVVNKLLELLKTLRFGSPFVKENAVRFQRVGFALLLGEAAKMGLGVIALGADIEVDINLQLISWIAIAAVFVLAEVFHEGARMKEDQDLTV